MSARVFERNMLIIILSLLIVFLLVCALENKTQAQEDTSIYRYMYFSNEDGNFSVDLEEELVYKWDDNIQEWIVWSGDILVFFEDAPMGRVSFN